MTTCLESTVLIGDANAWNDPVSLFSSAPSDMPYLPVAAGKTRLTAGKPGYFLMRRENQVDPGTEDLPRVFEETIRHVDELRSRVSVDTPDPFLNAAMGALNIGADALWDEPEGAIMHGAIAWRMKLAGWRGPWALDDLAWHDRARRNFSQWAVRQNTSAGSNEIPPADETANLARNEAGLHTNGDLSNSHYDMNLIFFDALFRHLMWTGDVEFAREMWPAIERHLAWERRLFRREFGDEKLPLYEAYAAIWASDDLQYHGGGTAHASAFNYHQNLMAARLAPLAGADPAPYLREAALIARAMRELLWLEDRGVFGESKDLLGLQRVHTSPGLWTFYHTMDSGLTDRSEAWRMAAWVDRGIPHIPVRGAGVPEGLYTLSTTNWMPYTWSLNNVVMAENCHAALGFWQAGRAEDAWKMTKGSLLAAMFMGITPGNVGTLSLFDVYRRESQRDFGDGAGAMSRAVIEGLFGVRPDALAGELALMPGFPRDWDHVALRHPDVDFSFRREGDREIYEVIPKFPKPMALRFRLPMSHEQVAAVTVNDMPAKWTVLDPEQPNACVEITAPASFRDRLSITWAGASRKACVSTDRETVKPMPHPVSKGPWKILDLSGFFNDQVPRIFKNEYRTPRSPFVSLALPKQGIGAWAGGIHELPEIDDSGLRASAAKLGGRIVLPDGLPFSTPSEVGARNVIFTSQWDNYPREVVVPLQGRARHVHLLMVGSTNPMQSRFENGEVVVTYQDGSSDRLALENPTTWWPIEQDYFVDDFQFPYEGPLPVRIDLKSGAVRVLENEGFKGRGGKVSGGAATVLGLELRPDRELKSLTVRALANEVVIGLMAATLAD